MERTSPEEVGLSSRALARIDEHLASRYVGPGKIPGALTLVARRGKVAHLSVLGSMDLERALPMREDTLFRIYSMTKPITSVALMMLYERGLFQLADPVHKWIPAFEGLRVFRSGRYPNFVTEPAQRPMSVADLLTHQAGLTYAIVERTGLDAAYRKLRVGGEEGTLADFVAQLATLPLEFSPGTRWNYSVATDVVGHLVELMSGEPFDVYLREQLFSPLGMHDTSFVVPAEKRERFAASYVRRGGRLTLLDDPHTGLFARPRTFLSGGGGLVSSAADYLRFVEMVRCGGVLDGVRILGPRTLRFMAQNHLRDGRDLAGAAVMLPGDILAEGVGFGLGFAVLLDPVRAQTPSSVGELSWGGLASTLFWTDPSEELTVLFFTQLIPSSTYDFRSDLRSLVYASIVD